jgi:hypothetical protein
MGRPDMRCVPVRSVENQATKMYYGDTCNNPFTLPGESSLTRWLVFLARCCPTTRSSGNLRQPLLSRV